jgi:hypothetical protein
MTELPPVIRCDRVGSYPWRVLHDRHPKLIEQVRAAHPYPPGVHEALDALLAEITAGVVTALPATVFDARDWEIFGSMGEHVGRSWFEAPFLWAESYFYRRLLDATGYFTVAHTDRLDPFGPAKQDELAAAVPDLDPARRFTAALWGNRGDLGFLASVPGSRDSARDDDLLVDDTAALWAHLERNRGLRVGYVADNAGTEILQDLVLIADLLDSGLVGEVTLHVKRQPFFVSDATEADTAAALAWLRRFSEPACRRLLDAYGAGRLRITAHPMFVGPAGYADWPPRELAYAFRDSDLTLFKGDLNYRRLVGDRHWHGTEDFAALVGYFPGPLVVLRTVKSEVVVGVPEARLRSLTAADPGWRLSGRHAMVQSRLDPPIEPSRTR